MGLASFAAHASISISNGSQVYTQNFDTLATTGTTNTWSNDSTLSGWNLFNKANAAITSYTADTGALNTGNFYSYGATGSSDRALGGLASSGVYFGSPASGALAGWIAANFTNNSGQILNGFSLSFVGEQWRNGGNATSQSMVMEYGFGSSFTTVSTWNTTVSSFSWASPVATLTAAAVDGNVAGLVSGIGGTIATNWNANDTLWLRWIENNDTGNDHGLAIDNISFTSGTVVSAVPVPGAIWLFGSALLGMIGFKRRKV